jgi:hypothetical protein
MVPLIITNLNSEGEFISPFKGEQKEIQDMVRLIDLFPTLLEIIGFQTIPDSNGESLLSIVSSSAVHFSSRSIYSESPPYGNLKISLIEPLIFSVIRKQMPYLT